MPPLMHDKNLAHYQHPHEFHEVNKSNVRQVAIVVAISVVAMMLEILFGWLSRSMALLSDGWHMGTHASAMSITLFTYYIAHKHKHDRSFSFGTWKVEVLGAYTSAILLGMAALSVLFSSIKRMISPETILYDQALIVALLGLGVNVICAIILGKNSHHEHAHPHGDDVNIHSARLHVVADALTSVFAILALLGAKILHLNFLDPVIGIVASVLIFRWAVQLLRETSSILLDRDGNRVLVEEIRSAIEADRDTKISDIHLWRVGQHKYSCLLSLVACTPQKVEAYKVLLKKIHKLAHIHIEIVRCHQHEQGDPSH